MKTKLLSLTLMTMLFSSITIAQTKTWDFGNDATTWPLSAGIGNDPMVVDNLGLYPIATNTNFGAVNASAYTFVADGFSSTRRFQTNGGGSPSSGTYLPTQRYLYFNATGACTVKVWFRTGSAGARKVYITDGTSLIASAGADATGASGDPFILTGAVTAAQATAGKIYIYGDGAVNMYKITVTGATVNTPSLANTDFQTSQVKVYSTGSQIYLANITSKTKAEVYTITGALVNSVSTEADTNFSVPTAGVYIVNVSSAEGKKSVKLVVQ